MMDIGHQRIGAVFFAFTVHSVISQHNDVLSRPSQGASEIHLKGRHYKLIVNNLELAIREETGER
jgi:hypothetical protein